MQSILFLLALVATTITLSIGYTDTPFTGMYSDPNHPDCFRKIIEGKNDKFEVYGQDNKAGEGVSCNTDDKSQLEDWGPLPASVNSTNIIVDFSPKGGPSDLTGAWCSKKQRIVWQDSNYWQHTYENKVRDGEKCCTSCPTGTDKYYSIPKLFNNCGESCIAAADYDIYKKLEPDLTFAESNTPCADKGYSVYKETETHGKNTKVAIELDMYTQP